MMQRYVLYATNPLLTLRNFDKCIGNLVIYCQVLIFVKYKLYAFLCVLKKEGEPTSFPYS